MRLSNIKFNRYADSFFGLSFLFPIITGLILGENIIDISLMFVIPMSFCLIFGYIFSSYFHIEEDIRNREAFALVSIAWIIMVLVSAFPYYTAEKGELMSYQVGIAGAIFESMSGLTTTGATILEITDQNQVINNEQYSEGYFDAPKSLLLWRSQTQWLGGMGIIVLATIIFSRLFGGGIQVLQAETLLVLVSRDLNLKWHKLHDFFGLYTFFLTLTEILLLYSAGLPLYDSICNSFSTVSTGGFSPKIDSIGSYDSAYVDIIVTFFMLISGVNFVILYYIFNHIKDNSKSIQSRIRNIYILVRDNEELKVYLFLIVSCSSLILLNLVLEFNENRTFNSNFSHTIFQTVSLLTGTGFTTTNYALWPKMSIFVLLLMFMGGCAGSTTGGMKTVRIMLLFKALKRELLLVIHPRAIIKLRIGKKVLDESLFRNVGVFFYFYYNISVRFFSHIISRAITNSNRWDIYFIIMLSQYWS